MIATHLYKLYNLYVSKLTTSTARTKFADLINRAEYAGERSIVHRRNKPVAAIVPIRDLEVIERCEEELDRRLIRKARKQKFTPWEQVKKELGL